VNISIQLLIFIVLFIIDIVAEHASDKSSSAVRAGAVNSISLLLEAEESHAVLRALLPSIGNLIHDKVERVRLATVKLLLQVKKISGIKYYHVVPVEHLQARLADEGLPPSNPHGPVPCVLTELMMNSYCPQGSNVSGTDQVKRTIAFLTSDPVAAHVFYSNIATHLSVSSVAKLTAMLLKCLCASVDTEKATMAENQAKEGKKRRRYGKQQQDNDYDEAEGGTTLTAANTSLMAALAKTICCLWESVSQMMH
jgi:condensin-2 complex subunit G2